MVTQATLKQEELPSTQADFRGVLTAPNGVGFRLLSGDGRLAGETSSFLRPPPASITGEQTAEEAVEVEGVLVASAREAGLPVICRVEPLPTGGQTASYVDRAETLMLRTASGVENLNMVLRYTGKPLDVALASARFLDALMGTSGPLAFEVPVPAVGDEFAGGTFRFGIGELPLPVPESFRQAHKSRLALLEALHEIRLATGVEVRYPEDSEDADDGLDALNFVLKAIRGGWVPSSVDSFTTRLGPEEVRVLLEELARDGEVGRAFLFDLPEESYDVFGVRINLGPSRRYVAAATLATGRGEMEAWLSSHPESGARLDLVWEPVVGVPMHAFFEDWPKTTLGSLGRELRELEAAYGVGTERFRRGREHGEAWAREIPDGARWAALAEAREELRKEPPEEPVQDPSDGA